MIRHLRALLALGPLFFLLPHLYAAAALAECQGNDRACVTDWRTGPAEIRVDPVSQSGRTYSPGTTADCTLTFFDGSTHAMTGIPVGQDVAIPPSAIPKDGQANIDAVCIAHEPDGAGGTVTSGQGPVTASLATYPFLSAGAPKAPVLRP